MDFIKYIILGIIQGITEPIPVSSSGHMLIFKRLLDAEMFNDINFEIIANFGSLIAIIIFYWKDLVTIFKNGYLYLKTKNEKYKSDFKYIGYVIVATIPVGIAGILFKDTLESVLSNIKVIGVALLVTALFLFLVRKMKGTKNDEDITLMDALIVSLFQAVALVPGISRSGSTLVAGMFRGFKRDTALRFSFLLYIPVSVGTTILGVKDLISEGVSTNVWLLYLSGMIAALVVTYFSLKWFIRIVKDGKLNYFVWYCLIVGTLVVIFL